MRFGRGGVAVAVMVVAVAASGCGRAAGAAPLVDDVARQAGVLVAHGGDDAARLPVAVRALPEQELPALAPAAGQEADRLVTPAVDDLDVDDARAVLGAACDTKDAYDVYRDWDEAWAVVAGKAPGTAGLRSRVTSLAEDLEDAETSGDAARELAVFAACEQA